MRTRGKKLLGILLSIMLVVGMLPAMSMTVHADDDQEPVKYLVGNEERTCPSYTLVTTDTTWSRGWYVVDTDVEFDNKVEATGDINLILCDGKELKFKAGICSTSTYGINIYAQSTGDNMGKLTVYGEGTSSGISSDQGNIGIYGGSIDASTGE